MYGRGMAGIAGAELRALGISAACILSGEKPGEAGVATELEAGLRACGLASTTVHVDGGVPRGDYASRLAEGLEEREGLCIVAVGGWGLISVAKAAAARLGLPLVVAPAAPVSGLEFSAEGYLLEDHGHLARRSLATPALVVVDDDVVERLGEWRPAEAWAAALEALTCRRASRLAALYAGEAVKALMRGRGEPGWVLLCADLAAWLAGPLLLPTLARVVGLHAGIPAGLAMAPLLLAWLEVAHPVIESGVEASLNPGWRKALGEQLGRDAEEALREAELRDKEVDLVVESTLTFHRAALDNSLVVCDRLGLARLVYSAFFMGVRYGP